jgi:hypothetical protein
MGVSSFAADVNPAVEVTNGERMQERRHTAIA